MINGAERRPAPAVHIKPRLLIVNDVVMVFLWSALLSVRRIAALCNKETGITQT